MVQINITIDDNDLANAFAQKAGQIPAEFDKMTRGIMDALELWIKDAAPRKTGKTKASVMKDVSSSGGAIWVSKAIAPYVYIVLDGSGPHKIYPKNKKALRVPGYGVFKSVQHPGTKSNPFVDKGADKAMNDIERKVNAFTEWLTEV